MLRKVVLLTLLAFSASYAETGFNPADANPRRVVFIENRTDDRTLIDSAHLTLASSPLTWDSDRERADLIFRFDRSSSEGNRVVNGDTISISIRNTVTLEVLNKQHKVIWKGAADLDESITRKDRSEQSWLDYLHRHPAAKLIHEFLAAVAKGD